MIRDIMRQIVLAVGVITSAWIIAGMPVMFYIIVWSTPLHSVMCSNVDNKTMISNDQFVEHPVPYAMSRVQAQTCIFLEQTSTMMSNWIPALFNAAKRMRAEGVLEYLQAENKIKTLY